MVSLSQVVVAAGLRGPNAAAVWWNEGRPAEAGRQVVVRDGQDALAAPFSARTRVHEYGGGAFTVHGDTLFFCNFADQRLYRGEEPLTPDDGGRSRYADLAVTPDGRWVVCVRERHLDSGVLNDLVAVPTDGGEAVVLAGGHDFYAAPRPSPDGQRLAWLSWDHPNMPWDGTELWVGDAEGRGAELVAGGPDESISQPRWSPDGRLHWISDRTGWWNLYGEPAGPAWPERSGGPERRGHPLAPRAAEFAGPDWTFGQSSYTFLLDGTLVATWTESGLGHLGVVGGSEITEIATPFTSFTSLQPLDREVVCVAASPSQAPAVVAIDVDSGDHRVIKASRATATPPEALSEPQPIEYPSQHGGPAHAFFYPPRLEGYAGLADERPPLIVRSHGGPTSAASSALNLEIQFWTSRGFAVVDVDYGGSTGYGREYRRRLDGQWGVVDLDDCVGAAQHLAAVGAVDPYRLAVRGGSAGGFTTLCALAFRDVFAAGASYYGVADLETLAADTHKFESRYLDRLIGPYPEARDLYRQRSPIHRADHIRAPVILFQGLEDAVVPPSQAEVLVAALRQNGVPFAYVTFEGEQHGFRQAATIRRAIEAELWFYGQVLGFEPADRIEPVEIENADRVGAAQRTSKVL